MSRPVKRGNEKLTTEGRSKTDCKRSRYLGGLRGCVNLKLGNKYCGGSKKPTADSRVSSGGVYERSDLDNESRPFWQLQVLHNFPVDDILYPFLRSLKNGTYILSDLCGDCRPNWVSQLPGMSSTENIHVVVTALRNTYQTRRDSDSKL